MENSNSVDQRLDAVKRLILSRPDVFRRQGAVVASWRTHNGTKRGPYFRLAYRRAGGKQHSIYLGPEHVANAVRSLLQELQCAASRRRQLTRLQRSAREQLRVARRRMDRQLRETGLYLHGSEVRGWRHRACNDQDLQTGRPIADKPGETCEHGNGNKSGPGPGAALD